MRAVLYDGFEQPLRVESVPDPEPPPHGAVIRVEATGLCRSDWHGWMGHDPDITSFPHVPGHELAGTVESVGPEVGGHEPGERVTVPFVCACGACEQCARGDHQVCDRQRQPGFTHWGSFAELVAVDWADVNLVTLPDDLDAAAAASLGCRFATAYRAVLQIGRARPGEWVVVHGCGGVGLSAVMIAAAAGARVVGVDVSPSALELAEDVGAEKVLPAGDPDAVREATDGGAHLSLDALGAEASAVASILSLRKRGRHVQVGVVPHPANVPLHRVMGWELELLGSHGLPAHAYPAMLDLVARGKLEPRRLVTRTIGLEDVPAALTALSASSPTGVTLIDPRDVAARPPRSFAAGLRRGRTSPEATEAQISIRVASAADALSFGTLLHAFNVEFGEATPDAAVIAERATALIESGEMTVLLAGGGPDGFAELRFRPSLYTGALDAYLEELYVVPERRGRGLGRALLEAAMDNAREHGAAHIDLGTGEEDVAARSLYESAGFTNREGGPAGPRMLYYERDL